MKVICTKCGHACTDDDFPLRKNRQTLRPNMPCYSCRAQRERLRRATQRIAKPITRPEVAA